MNLIDQVLRGTGFLTPVHVTAPNWPALYDQRAFPTPEDRHWFAEQGFVEMLASSPIRFADVADSAVGIPWVSPEEKDLLIGDVPLEGGSWEQFDAATTTVIEFLPMDAGHLIVPQDFDQNAATIDVFHVERTDEETLTLLTHRLASVAEVPNPGSRTEPVRQNLAMSPNKRCRVVRRGVGSDGVLDCAGEECHSGCRKYLVASRGSSATLLVCEC